MMRQKLSFMLLAWMVLPIAQLMAQGFITIDHKTQRYINDVSTFDRGKYANVHMLETGYDAQFDVFKKAYNIGDDYKGGRGFWNPFSKVKNGVIPNVSNKYNGVRAVNKRWVATGTAGNLFYDEAIDYSEKDISQFSKDAASYVARSYKDDWDNMPEYIEVFNEPFVHADEYYPSGWSSAKNLKIITKMCEFHRDLGQAIHATPELTNLKVTGYASAYPEFESSDFQHWSTKYKTFIDIAGADMDVLSLHLYDGSGINNSGGRRSGSNVEAIMDLIEAYSFIKFNKVKPMAVTEYGRLVSNQPDWSSGNGKWNFEAVENSQAPRSQIHMAMSFMERADHFDIAIPFNVDTRNPTSQYSKSTLWINNNGSIEITSRKYLYEMLKDLNGERVRINSSNIDVQTQAFVDGNQLFVMLNNLNDETQHVDLHLLDKIELQEVKTKRLKIFLDKVPELTNTSSSTAPAGISLEYSETAVLTYTFDSAITFDNSIQSKKYYATEYLKPITANAANSFIFNNVEVGEGFATLRVGVGRAHGKTLKPSILVNGEAIVYDGDIIRGYDQHNRKQFFGALEIPVAIGKLKNGTNTVDIIFSDDGGRISSVILQVQKADQPIVLIEDDDSDGVFNADDKCPDTPLNALVDEDGCMIDDDMDGVLNDNDECPNTPLGLAVDENGCSIDDDADGVLNDIDLCAGTEVGVEVDENGCAVIGYSIQLILKNKSSGATIKNATVNINGSTEISDASGKVEFQLLAGEYPFSIEHDSYQHHDTLVIYGNVDSTILLRKTHVDLTVMVTENGAFLGGSYVVFGGVSQKTNTVGYTVFKDIKVDSAYQYEVLKNDESIKTGTYKVVGGVIFKIEVTETGVADVNQTLLTLFPNPVSENLYISGLSKPTTYFIYNSLAKKVQQGIIQNKSIGVDELQQGIYFLVVENKGQYRFVKN